MNFIDKLITQLKDDSDKKIIILPESEDIRVLQAAEKITSLGFAKIILIGQIDKIRKLKSDINLDDIEVINPLTYDLYDELCNDLYELRKHKGITLEQAKEILKDYTHFGILLLKKGLADGVVSGASHSTAATLRPALQIIKTNKDAKLVSSAFLMEIPSCEYGEKGMLLFSDCGLLENPTAEELSEIAVAAAYTWSQFIGTEPKIAMLSYSTKGSASSEMVNKVIEGTRLVKEKNPHLKVDGDLQLDAALVPEVARMKAPDSDVAGQANILIFPDLNAGNIGYKLVERFAKANAYGPITQGLAKPVNDLSRGCKTDDIVGVVAMTCIQAKGQ